MSSSIRIRISCKYEDNIHLHKEFKNHKVIKRVKVSKGSENIDLTIEPHKGVSLWAALCSWKDFMAFSHDFKYLKNYNYSKAYFDEDGNISVLNQDNDFILYPISDIASKNGAALNELDINDIIKLLINNSFFKFLLKNCEINQGECNV